ncbi:MAG: NAD(P)-dependent alcohol dehydrogenase [Candidatus Thorarchaeota archaeon]|nr:MAG: NAD(P)-dependent alcohol dehydrogenase [Candidatus Thorarchaeota archaeon]
MKAIVGKRYGAPENLQFREVEKPTPRDNEVLIEVHASSLNAADFERLRGSLITRMTGPQRPKDKIPGTDVAGTVEAVGSTITQFQPGDEIVGDLFYSGSGAFAEYVCAPEKVLTLKPSTMTFEQAATYPQAAIIALQSLRGDREIQPGQKVLVNGAGGGMGTFAVQIAKYYGAEVTGVDSAEKLDMLHSIGADHTIDYTQTDYTNIGQCYDLILDTVANRSISDYKRALTSDGLFVMVGGSRSALFQAAIIAPLKTRNDSRKMGINWWSKPYNKDDMDFLAKLFDEGKVVPVIDKRYTLSGVPEALKYLEDGHVLGKVVITIKDDFS